MDSYPNLENKDLKKMKVSYDYTNPTLHFEVEEDVYVIEDFEFVKIQ